ncbi:MAG: hypothetical protein ACYTEQ_23755 [Planctomycetota bacterium]|jgi:hypothetical protein
MSNSELELIICRNSQFLTVRRSGSADGGSVGLYNSITGEYLRGIGPGRIPEYSYMLPVAPRLVRGWRNIMYDLLTMGKLMPTKEIRSWLGSDVVSDVMDYGLRAAPMETPEPTKVYIDGNYASGISGKDWQGGA